MDKLKNYINPSTNETEFSYYITDQNTVVISKYLGQATAVIIPETIEGLPVTKVDTEAFKGNLTLKTISMTSIKTVSSNAFDTCTSLTTVFAPDLSSIINNVFSNCSSLVDISLPRLNYIGYHCFTNCTSLESANLPNIVYIPDNTFSYCSNLKNVNAPRIKDIGPYAFQYCLALENLNIPDTNNINVPLLEYVDTFAFYNSGLINANMPRLTALGHEAFSHCITLENLTLPKDLSIIGNNVFDSSIVMNLIIYYGIENMCTVTIDDWNTFASKLTGIDGVSIPGKYVKNDLYTRNLSNTNNLLTCTQIVASVNAPVAMKWAVELLDGKIIYISNTLYKWETMILHLTDLNIPYGTQFRLKAIVDAKSDDYCNEIFEYSPRCYSLFYEYQSTGPEYQAEINSSLKPPALKCSSVSVHHDGKAIVKYQLILRANNSLLYTSGRYTNGEKWTKSFSDLNVPPGGQLILHANVIGGDDSEPYVILQNDPDAPTDEDTALFSYVGNAFYTAVLYKGIN